MKLRAAIMASTFLLAAAAAWAANTPDKKLIEYGWDVPDTQFVRANVREMEEIPFDGVVIRVSSKDQKIGSFGWRVFSRVKIEPEDYEHAIEDLKATRFQRFTDNFIQVIAYPGDVDWFDPEWPIVAENAACLAKVAKQGGCVGIMFDPEMYHEQYQIWDYRKFPADWKAMHSFEEARAKVKQRGQEFMQAVNREYPGLTILCLYAQSLPYTQSIGRPEDRNYNLMSAFFNGMYEAASPGTTIVDGYEFSYGHRTAEEFIKGWRAMMVGARSMADNREKFVEHTQAGFGIWVDLDAKQHGWNTEDFSTNYFTPAGFRASLAYALAYSSKYVWVYSQDLRWWNRIKMPQEYVDALALAKKGPGRGEPSPLAVRAATMPGYGDDETFAGMRETMTEVYDFPKDGWRFMRDILGSGIRRGYHRSRHDYSGWRAISIGKFWEEQGELYDGQGWYRTTFSAPAIERGKRLFLAVGAADEEATVWLNDQYVGYANVGWTTPFVLDVTDAIRPGQENSIVFMIKDTSGVGGLWKSIKLMVEEGVEGVE